MCNSIWGIVAVPTSSAWCVMGYGVYVIEYSRISTPSSKHSFIYHETEYPSIH